MGRGSLDHRIVFSLLGFHSSFVARFLVGLVSRAFTNIAALSLSIVLVAGFYDICDVYDKSGGFSSTIL